MQLISQCIKITFLFKSFKFILFCTQPTIVILPTVNGRVLCKEILIRSSTSKHKNRNVLFLMVVIHIMIYEHIEIIG